MNRPTSHLVAIGSIVLFLATNGATQERLADILQSSNDFNEIVASGEAYFQTKHPSRSLKDLAQGEYRDGEFVKFMRWQNYWKNALNSDGTLGDITAYWREEHNYNKRSAGSLSPYNEAVWTNLSYEDYIVSQIGLGRTTSIGFHPTNANIFYVGAAIGGIWKTTDGGQNYSPLGDELPFMAVSSIIVKKNNPNHIFIAVSDHVWYGPPGIGVYKSINSGATWQPTALSFNLADNIRIYWMEADPNNPDKIFVATSNGLYRTTDVFQNVTKINSVSSFDVKINPGNSNIVYQGGNNGEFYRSVNGGTSFSLIQDFGSDNVYIATTALNTAKVYARNGSTLYKSTDSGATFPANNPIPVSNSVLAFSPSNQNILLAGNFETNRSDNDGSSFYATSQWLGGGGLPLIHVDQRNIFTNPLEPDYVYYCNDGGVYRYVISTNSFVNLSNGLMITQFYDIAVAQTDDNVIGGGSQDNGNVFRAANGVWDDYAPTGDGMNQEIDPTDANERYWAYQNGAIRRWDGGLNTPISPPGQDGQGAWETPFRLDPMNPSRLIAGYDKIYESLNKGTSWTDISGTANFGGDVEEIAIAKSNPNRIYVARASQFFVKDVSGNTWTTKSLPMPISDLEVDPTNMDVVYITTPGFTAGTKVYKSTDAGTTWMNISGSLPNVSTGAIEIYESMPGGLFVGTDAGVYYRDNRFADWQQYGHVPHTRVEDIEIQYTAKLIRIGTHGRGVLEAPIVIEACDYGDPDADNDGICDANDPCPDFDNSLIGMPCDDGDPSTTGETWSVNCGCEGGMAVLNYCAAAGSVGTGGDWIERVSLNTLDHSSGFSAYSDFRSQSTTLAPGGQYTLSIDLFQSFPLDAVYAWIDYDRDGTFEGSELITMSGFNAENASAGTVVVPANVGMEATTMRVRSIYADPNTAQACGNYFGEVEDYTINFSHCAARGSFGTGSDWVQRVKLNTIDNSSIQTYYSDFTNLCTDLVRGGSYPIEITMNYAFPINSVYVWIDYDQDGDFEATEQITLPPFTVGFNQTSMTTINVPANALPGRTIMRIRSQYDDPNNAQACGNVYAGEVEDYAINITYCAAAGAAGTGGDYINRVTFNTINNFSGKTTYSDFKNLTTDLIRGASYPIEVQMQYAFDIDSVYVWIDFDKDGQFESNEQTIMSQLTPLIFNGVATGMVNVPGDAIQGETVMRVRSIYSNSNTAEPCDGAYFGEVEDYTVNLTYCAGNGAIGDDHITRVQLNTIDNISASSGYGLYQSVQTTLYHNNSYELMVNMNNTLNGDRVFAWIDYDQNGSFTSDERLSMTIPGAGINTLSTGTIDVDPMMALGETTLRIRFSYASTPDPCGNYGGEVEDYTLIFESADNICNDVDLVLGNESLPTATFSGIQTLNSSSTIENGKTVLFTAGVSISLASGFNVQAGSNFTALIQDCPPPPTLLDEMPRGELPQSVSKRSSQSQIELKPTLGETNVVFSLASDETVSLELLSHTGQQLDVLVDHEWFSAGEHMNLINTRDLENGVYFIVLRTAGETLTKRLALFN